MVNGPDVARQLRTDVVTVAPARPKAEKVVDFGVTIVISAVAGLALPFVQEACTKLPPYRAVLMGGWLAAASLSLAAWWATRRPR